MSKVLFFIHRSRCRPSTDRVQPDEMFSSVNYFSILMDTPAQQKFGNNKLMYMADLAFDTSARKLLKCRRAPGTYDIWTHAIPDVVQGYDNKWIEEFKALLTFNDQFLLPASLMFFFQQYET